MNKRDELALAREMEADCTLMVGRKRCPFCELALRPLLIENSFAVAFADVNPVSPGHTLVVTRRHVATYFEATPDEKIAIWNLVDRVRERHRPDGFNVGFNAGVAAGQTVMHAHVHVIPRYVGDVADPRGGVRHAVTGCRSKP